MKSDSIIDLNELDFIARDNLRVDIRKLRESMGISQFKLTNMYGGGKDAQLTFEKSTKWKVKTVQRVARSLNMRFIMRPVDLPTNVDDDAYSIILRSTTPSSPEDWDELHLSWMKNYLVRTRYHLGLTTGEVARTLDISTGAIWAWEASDDDPMLYVLQRYARILGGYLDLELAPAADCTEVSHFTDGVTS